MFKRPEEIIVLILALLWVGLSYYFAAILISDAYTILLITVLTFVWAAICFFFMATQLKPSYLAAVPRQPGCLLVAVLHLACKRCSRRHMVFRLDIQIHYRPDSRCGCLYLQVETEPKKQNLQYPCLIPRAVFFRRRFPYLT